MKKLVALLLALLLMAGMPMMASAELRLATTYEEAQESFAAGFSFAEHMTFFTNDMIPLDELPKEEANFWVADINGQSGFWQYYNVQETVHVIEVESLANLFDGSISRIGGVIANTDLPIPPEFPDWDRETPFLSLVTEIVAFNYNADTRDWNDTPVSVPCYVELTNVRSLAEKIPEQADVAAAEDSPFDVDVVLHPPGADWYPHSDNAWMNGWYSGLNSEGKQMYVFDETRPIYVTVRFVGADMMWESLMFKVVERSAESSAPAPEPDVLLLAESETTVNLYSPIRRATIEDSRISITFDSSWDSANVPEILRILDENQVKATFFVCGTWVDKNMDALLEIYEAGHEIANHGDKHLHVAEYSLERNRKEIVGVHDKIVEALGFEMNLYRPPYGEYNSSTIKAANELGYYTVNWDVDSLDWMALGAEKEIRQVLDNKSLGNGSILLFHTDPNSIYTPVVLDEILKSLKDSGYQMVVTSELLGLASPGVKSE